MNPYIFIFLISFVPLFESRYAIIYAYYNGIPLYKAYAVLAAATALQATLLPILLPHLDKVIFKHFPRIRKTVLERARRKGEKIKNSKKTYAELFLFVATPLPGTGIYTASLVYYILSLDKKKTAVALLAGGLTAMTINTLVTYGIIETTFALPK